MLSVLILTKNEEANLPACLASVKWCDDVVVLDSFSTDRTVDLARAAGVRVEQRAFDDFAGQRNHALDRIPFKHPWVFHLDADEQFTAPLRTECEQAIAANQHSGYMVPNKLVFEGRWLKHAGMYPTYQMRLLKLGEVRFVQHGHGQREADAKRGIGTLHEPYLHFNFSKGIGDWLEKHQRYARAEAAHEFDAEKHLDVRGVVSGDALRRRRALKQLSSRLPFRPALRFLYTYVLRRGFLDGFPGYRYSRLLATYEGMIVCELESLRQERKAETS